MSKSSKEKKIILGSALAGLILAGPSLSLTANPAGAGKFFRTAQLSVGYRQAQAADAKKDAAADTTKKDTMDGDKKCGSNKHCSPDAKCSADKKGMTDKHCAGDKHCSPEAKCSADMKGKTDKHCAGDKNCSADKKGADMKGSTSSTPDKGKKGEMSCGPGTCGASKSK